MKKMLQNKKLCTLVIVIAGILGLAITSHGRTFLGNDGVTIGLIWNSEYLVLGQMTMSYQPGMGCEYGLGDMLPYSNASVESALTSEELNFEYGYSLKEKKIAVTDNEATRMIFQEGSILTFVSGDKATISNVTAENGYLFVEYEADRIYSHKNQDNLKYVTIYNPETGSYRQVGESVPYVSQIGLQGAVFRAFPKEYTVGQMKEIYHWILAVLYAVTMTLICYQIYKKYNLLFAVIFYAVTILSPWLIGYSTNLYWVSFTWFLPMLCGIFCSNHIQSKTARIVSYAGVMAAVAVKCACGYEFITTIMLSAIVFLLTDFGVAVLERRKKQEVLHIFKTIFAMGIFALAGFAIAIIIHGYMRGNGDVLAGLRSIYYTDVLRRTLGGTADMFQTDYADSLNAPVWYVVARYLLFDTPVIRGVPGILFIPLVALSFILLVVGIKKNFVNKEILVLYIWMGVASVSWFVLGKSHSYIHTFMNFVLWYFGYVQIVFYVIISVMHNCYKYIEGRRKCTKK